MSSIVWNPTLLINSRTGSVVHWQCYPVECSNWLAIRGHYGFRLSTLQALPHPLRILNIYSFRFSSQEFNGSYQFNGFFSGSFTYTRISLLFFLLYRKRKNELYIIMNQNYFKKKPKYFKHKSCNLHFLLLSLKRFWKWKMLAFGVQKVYRLFNFYLLNLNDELIIFAIFYQFTWVTAN